MARLSSRLAFGAVAAAIGLIAWSVPAQADTLYPTAPLTLRSGPGFTFDSMGLVAANSATYLVEAKGSWYHVKLSDGRDGWVPGISSRVVFDRPVTLEFPFDVETRTGPSWMTAVSGKVAGGTTLTAREMTAGYYTVSVGGKNVYVDGSRVTVKVPPASPGSQTPLPVSDKRVQVLSSGTPMRTGRSTDYSAMATLGPADSDSLTFLTAKEGWVQVHTAAGKEGWIDGQQVYLSDKVAFPKQVTYDVADGRWVMAYKFLVTVATSDGLNLRQSAATTAPVLSVLAQGAQLRVLSSQGSWQRVQAPDGKIGWVDGTWTKQIQAPAPQLARTSLKVTGTNVLQLEISGTFAQAAVSGAQTGKTLTIGIPDAGALPGSMPVGDHGVAVLAQGTDGVKLSFDGTMGYQVLENSPGHVLVEVRPHVSDFAYLRGTDDRRIFRLAVNGEVDAKVTRVGTNVIVDLPGAVLDGGTPPAGMTVWQTATGVRAQVTSERAFALKRRAGQLDLVFFSGTLVGKTIVLDPGHGGVESGAVGPTGALEKNMNLATSLVLRDLLIQAGAKVIMTRTTDTRASSPAETKNMDSASALRYDLNARTLVANKAEADLFISVHSNGGPSTWRGTETFYCSTNFNAYSSQRAATLAQRSLIPALGLKDMGVDDQDFYVVKFTDAPAILVEQAFLTNATEEALLKSPDFRAKVAKAMVPAIQKFFQAEY